MDSTNYQELPGENIVPPVKTLTLVPKTLVMYGLKNFQTVSLKLAVCVSFGKTICIILLLCNGIVYFKGRPESLQFFQKTAFGGTIILIEYGDAGHIIVFVPRTDSL